MAKQKKKKRVWKKILFVFGLVISAVTGSILATAKWNLDQSLGLINYDDKNKLSDVDLSGIDVKFDSDVVNILLVGVDSSTNNKRSSATIDRSNSKNTDTMMIATMDLKNKELKVTSLMRDLYVTIAEPRNADGKLNSAFANGGMDCLYKTIASNFGVKLDAYALINLDAFTDLVNEIGGVELTLTESEAYNLNNTNYIIKKRYRNLKAGKQVLNGYQAMGYCQIRHGKKGDPNWGVYSLSGKADDYGRTERQRLFMQALFTKVKSLSLNQWLELAEVVLPNIKT
ncbi:MAG: LCP family protein, partial [Lachnoclostridium sp.]|nr:LCP family protein [Lachnoclostridium sp.]